MSTISRSSNTHDMLLSAFNSHTCVHSFFFTCHAEIVVATLEAFVSDTHHRCATAIATNSTMSVANPGRTPGRLVGYPHVSLIIFEIWMTYWVFNERDSKSKAKHYVSIAVLVIELHNPFGFHNNLCKIDIKIYHASSESGSETIVNFLWFWLLQKKCVRWGHTFASHVISTMISSIEARLLKNNPLCYGCGSVDVMFWILSKNSFAQRNYDENCYLSHQKLKMQIWTDGHHARILSEKGIGDMRIVPQVCRRFSCPLICFGSGNNSKRHVPKLFADIIAFFNWHFFIESHAGTQICLPPTILIGHAI